jgi:hypothetical protein
MYLQLLQRRIDHGTFRFAVGALTEIDHWHARSIVLLNQTPRLAMFTQHL